MDRAELENKLAGRTKQKIRLPIFQDRPSGGIAGCTYDCSAADIHQN
jgi:hypothetical protein